MKRSILFIVCLCFLLVFRVIADADALDAMFSARSYKPAYDMQRVRSELVTGAGRQFDPKVTEAALSWLDDRPREHTNPVHTP